MSNTKLLCENIVYGQSFLNGKKQLLDNRLGFDKKSWISVSVSRNLWHDQFILLHPIGNSLASNLKPYNAKIYYTGIFSTPSISLLIENKTFPLSKIRSRNWQAIWASTDLKFQSHKQTICSRNQKYDPATAKSS